RGAVLHEDVGAAVGGPAVDPADQPVEAVEVGPDQNQDPRRHSSGPTTTEPGENFRCSSHCTRNSRVNGRHSRPVSVGESILSYTSRYTVGIPRSQASTKNGTATPAPVDTMTDGFARRSRRNASPVFRIRFGMLRVVGWCAHAT